MEVGSRERGRKSSVLLNPVGDQLDHVTNRVGLDLFELCVPTSTLPSSSSTSTHASDDNCRLLPSVSFGMNNRLKLNTLSLYRLPAAASSSVCMHARIISTCRNLTTVAC